MQAMILAAGFGTRLLPHTLLCPKPLFPVLNEPLLLVTIRRLQRAGFDHIIVNAHHLRGQIVELLQGVSGVAVQLEEDILGTGGGLRRALAMMRDEPLLVTNGDIYHTIDFSRFYHDHRASAQRVTLALHDCPRFNTVRVDGEWIVGFPGGASTPKMLAFTGVSVLDPQILAPIEDGRQSCIIEHYRAMLQEGQRLRGARVDDCFWTDMGTPQDYLALHSGLLQGRIPRWPEFAAATGGPILVDGRACLAGSSHFDDWCAIGAASGRDVSLARCVVWDGVVLPDGYHGEDQLISASPAERVDGDREK